MEIKDCSGYIFDMDGVVFNTEEVWKYAYMHANKVMNANVSEDYRKTMCGKTREDIIRMMGNDFPGLDSLTYRLAAEDYTNTELREGRFEFRPHFLDFIKVLKAKNKKIALATSATRERTEFMFSKKNINKFDIFDGVISGDDVIGHSKPDPFIYRKAAETINLTENDCCVIEDSINGIIGAYNGGFAPVMCVDLIEPNDFCLTHCKAIVRGFDELIKMID